MKYFKKQPVLVKPKKKTVAGVVTAFTNEMQMIKDDQEKIISQQQNIIKQAESIKLLAEEENFSATNFIKNFTDLTKS